MLMADETAEDLARRSACTYLEELTMADEKATLAAAIMSAQARLHDALAALEALPVLDPDAIAFATHALNNFLTITGGTLELLLEALQAYPDPQIPAWLGGLLHVTDLMTLTVNRLVTPTPLETKHLEFARVDLPISVQRVCHYYQRHAERKQLTIHLDVRAVVPPVWTDRMAVVAVLNNVLSNAIKFSPPGKSIWVSLDGDATSATCRVQDEGPGLSEAEQAQLFQRGVRLSPQPTGGEATSGYGLAVAKELIDLVGGSIWCRSTPGHGACFAFRLPAAPVD
jgi:two-component system, sensor histidine kinase LadS